MIIVLFSLVFLINTYTSGQKRLSPQDQQKILQYYQKQSNTKLSPQEQKKILAYYQQKMYPQNSQKKQMSKQQKSLQEQQQQQAAAAAQQQQQMMAGPKESKLDELLNKFGEYGGPALMALQMGEIGKKGIDSLRGKKEPSKEEKISSKKSKNPFEGDEKLIAEPVKKTQSLPKETVTPIKTAPVEITKTPSFTGEFHEF